MPPCKLRGRYDKHGLPTKSLIAITYPNLMAIQGLRIFGKPSTSLAEAGTDVADSEHDYPDLLDGRNEPQNVDDCENVDPNLSYEPNGDSKKRPSDTIIEDVTSRSATRRKRRALEAADVRVNSLAGAAYNAASLLRSNNSPADLLQQSDAASTTNTKRTSIYRKNWPRLQDAEAFAHSPHKEQRKELTNYMADLVEYTTLIEAGAVPTPFIVKLIERLEEHFAELDEQRENWQRMAEARRSADLQREETLRKGLQTISKKLAWRVNHILDETDPSKSENHYLLGYNFDVDL